MDFPPLHPILVNFTAALVPVSAISDLLGALLRKESLCVTAWWTLLFASIITPFTALAGWIWMRNIGDMGHGEEMAVHQWLGISLTAAVALLAIWRWRIYLRGNSPRVAYLGTTVAITVALVVQGHVGGTMSFGTAPSPEPAVRSAHEDTHRQHLPEYQWQDYLDVEKK